MQSNITIIWFCMPHRLISNKSGTNWVTKTELVWPDTTGHKLSGPDRRRWTERTRAPDKTHSNRVYGLPGQKSWIVNPQVVGSSPTPGATNMQVRVGLSGPALFASKLAGEYVPFAVDVA